MEIKIQIIVRIFILAQLLNVQSKFIAWHIILLPMPGCKFFSKVFSRLYSLPKMIPLEMQHTLHAWKVVGIGWSRCLFAKKLKWYNNDSLIRWDLACKIPLCEMFEMWRHTLETHFSVILIRCSFVFYFLWHGVHSPKLFQILPLKTTPLFDRSFFLPPFLPPPFIITYSWILSY